MNPWEPPPLIKLDAVESFFRMKITTPEVTITGRNRIARATVRPWNFWLSSSAKNSPNTRIMKDSVSMVFKLPTSSLTKVGSLVNSAR